jgi:hypothetical protein
MYVRVYSPYHLLAVRECRRQVLVILADPYVSDVVLKYVCTSVYISDVCTVVALSMHIQTQVVSTYHLLAVLEGGGQVLVVLVDAHHARQDVRLGHVACSRSGGAADKCLLVRCTRDAALG